MNICPDCSLNNDSTETQCVDCGRLLKGMQGPEQGLVGESRSARKQGHAEEAKPGERGVGEIVELAELLRHLDRKIEEARGKKIEARATGEPPFGTYYHGKQSALTELREDVARMAEKRSDLSNAGALLPGTPERSQKHE